MTLSQHGAIVIGAGVAGLSTALYLRRAGVAVAVIDPLPPAGGASFGNAGLLSPDTAVPIALPGMLRKVPGWLTDPLGPLSVRPAISRGRCRGCCAGSKPGGSTACWRSPTRCAHCTGMR